MPRSGPLPPAHSPVRSRLAAVGALVIGTLALTGCVSFPVINVPASGAQDRPAATADPAPEPADSATESADAPVSPDPDPDAQRAGRGKPTTPAPPAPAPAAQPGRVGAPTLAADALRTSDGVVRFLTPSGNIYCEIAPALGASSAAGVSALPTLGFQGEAGVNCELGVYPDPSPADLAAVDCGSIGLHGGSILITAEAQLYGSCRGGASFMNLVASGQQPPPAVSTFAYGNAISEAGFRCHSAFEGLTCESETTGRGFFASRERTEFFGS